MPRPQFTLRALLISVSYLALACGCFRGAFVAKNYTDWPWVWAYWLGLTGFVSLGAGIGALFKQQAEGAAVMLALGAFLAFVLVLIVFSD